MENNKMKAILAEVGQAPRVCELSIDGEVQQEEIRDLLAGNFGATEFFSVTDEVSLFILTNDLSAALGLKANRRFPGADKDTIIFGNAIFIAAYNDRAPADKEGTIDMPDHVCKMFIEQIQQHFELCLGDEKPRSEDEVYYENVGEDSEQAYKWQEIEKPAKLSRFIEAGRARFYENTDGTEILCINARYFKKVIVHTNKSKLS